MHQNGFIQSLWPCHDCWLRHHDARQWFDLHGRRHRTPSYESWFVHLTMTTVRWRNALIAMCAYGCANGNVSLKRRTNCVRYVLHSTNCRMGIHSRERISMPSEPQRIQTVVLVSMETWIPCICDILDYWNRQINENHVENEYGMWRAPVADVHLLSIFFVWWFFAHWHARQK